MLVTGRRVNPKTPHARTLAPREWDRGGGGGRVGEFVSSRRACVQEKASRTAHVHPPSIHPPLQLLGVTSGMGS